PQHPRKEQRIPQRHAQDCQSKPREAQSWHEGAGSKCTKKTTSNQGAAGPEQAGARRTCRQGGGPAAAAQWSLCLWWRGRGRGRVLRWL
ncbi:hypothetical protein MCOR16_011464, partial [Pyricularia oryzae]